MTENFEEELKEAYADVFEAIGEYGMSYYRQHESDLASEVEDEED
jgi:Tat protein secretion system quality control protein TatD with DNase activity